MKVLVTGTSSGIGKAISEKFLSCGHEVIGIDVCESTVTHPSYTHYRADIASGELPEISGIRVLVNNAGVQDSGRDIDVNLKGTIRVTEKYGICDGIQSVLFIASASAHNGSEFPEYAASKGGMIAYMKNVALRVAKYGDERQKNVGKDNGADASPEVGERGRNSGMGVFRDRYQ